MFPEKLANTQFKNDYRRGSLSGNGIFKKLFQKIMNDKAIKLALVSIFLTAGAQYFYQETEQLLTDNAFEQICVKDTEGNLRIVCNIIQEHELNLHTKALKELIVDNNLSNSDKINLLKIKLDFIINGECGGKKRFLVVCIIAALMAVSISGIGGLSLFLEALYRLFQEGKISRALYEQILEIVGKRWKKVPIDNFL